MSVLKAAVDYWASELQRADKREAFRDALTKILERDYKPGESMRLVADYDPLDQLLEAVQAADIKCRGCMFSADGLFHYKTRTRITADGRFEVSEGYGASPRQVYPPPAEGARR